MHDLASTREGSNDTFGRGTYARADRSIFILISNWDGTDVAARRLMSDENIPARIT